MGHEVHISNRFLVAEGVISPQLEAILRTELRMVAGAEERICALTYAYDTIPLGFQFEVAFLLTEPTQAIKARSIVKAVTQQFFKPFDVIPRWWKTFTLLSFPDGVPVLIQKLPVVDDWYESKWEERVCLSSEETWKAILVKYKSAPAWWRVENGS